MSIKTSESNLCIQKAHREVSDLLTPTHLGVGTEISKLWYNTDIDKIGKTDIRHFFFPDNQEASMK